MKTQPLVTLTLAGALLALTAPAQEGPSRTLPAPLPGIAVQSAPAPDVPPPGLDFPIDPGMPEEGWAEPGFPGDMIMPPMHGRYKIMTVQMPQAGKIMPFVLKLDTQTGQVWQLKLTETKIFFNGKAQVQTRLTFEPIAGGQPQHPDHGHGFVPGNPDIVGDTDVDRAEPDVIRVVPEEPREVRPIPVRPRRNIPQTSPTPAPAPRPRR